MDEPKRQASHAHHTNIIHQLLNIYPASKKEVSESIKRPRAGTGVTAAPTGENNV